MLHRTEIPEFLQNSELYKNCLEENQDEIPIPDNESYYFTNLNPSSNEDFIKLLKTIHFWNAEPPNEIYQWFIENKKKINMELVKDSFTEKKLSLIDEIQIICDYDKDWKNKNDDNLFSYVLIRNSHVLVKYLLANGYTIPEYALCITAQYGDLNMMKFLRENNIAWPEHKGYRQINDIAGYDIRDCICHGICATAAERGELEMLKYAHENGVWWDMNTISYAVANDNLECMIYVMDNTKDEAMIEHLYSSLESEYIGKKCREYMSNLYKNKISELLSEMGLLL